MLVLDDARVGNLAPGVVGHGHALVILLVERLGLEVQAAVLERAQLILKVSCRGPTLNLSVALFEKVMLRYDVLSEKRRPAIDHCFTRGFLPNGGHPLVLFKWRLGTNVCILIVPDYRLVGLLDDTVRCSQ